MKRRIFCLALSFIFLLVGFSGCAQEKTIFSQDQKTLSSEAIGRAIEATVLIADNSKNIIGRGWIGKGNYVLTASHVVSEGISEGFYLLAGKDCYGPFMPVFVKQGKDFALLKIPETVDLTSFEIGNSDNLTPGALIYYIGFQNKIEEKILKKGKAVFMTSSSLEFSSGGNINFGESGAPVLILENGELKVIGILRAMTSGRDRGVAILINPVVETIQKEEGINLRD